MSRVLLLTVLSATLLLSGCPKRDAIQETPAGTDAAGQAGAGTAGGDKGGLPAGEAVGGTAGAAGDTQQGMLGQHIIYFDYDQSEIRAEYNELVSAHARNLATRPSVKVRLEGHSDERGSREYNIGLGERRAQAVRRALMLQGVADDQIVTVSYGEERPSTEGSDEAAWSKNRRVEIVYAN